MAEMLVKRRWVAALLVLLAVGATVPGLEKAVVPDNSLTVWFLETDPQMAAYKEFQERFGNDEVVLLQVEEPEGLFTPGAMARLTELESRLAAIDGVHRVTSILNVQDLYDTPGGLVYRPLVPHPAPTDAATLAELGTRATTNDVFRDRLVSADGRRAMLWIQMEVMDDIDAKRDRIVAETYRVADEVLGETPHPMGGVGVIYSGLNLITQHDFGLFLGLGYFIMFFVLWWIFRSVLLVLAALGVIAVATIAALGIYGLFGHQLNMVTVVLPTLIIVLGLADAIHFPAAFVQVRAEHPDAPRFDQVVRTLRRVLVPCLFTTLTTIGGFLALASSPMAVIRHLGIYSAIGLAVALVASTVFMTLACFRLKPRAELPQRWLTRAILARCGRLVTHRPVLLAVLSILLAGVATVGAFHVEADTYTIGYLPDDHRVVRDHEALEAGWGDYSVLDFTVTPAAGLRTDSPEVLNATERFIAAASRLDAIRDGFGLAHLYRRMITVMGSDKPADEPLRADEVAQLGLIFESQDFEWERTQPAFDDNVLAPLTTEDRSLGRITLVGRMCSAMALDETLQRLQTIADETMAGAATLTPAGYPPLYVRIIDYVITSQTRSFFIAIGVIFTLMLLWLRSFRLALVSLLPNLFPIALMLGAMRAFDIHLDVATATVAAMVIGVAIDDTVHFMHHWRAAEKEGKSWAEVLQSTYAKAGSPAITTTLVLVLGYPVLMLAGVKTVVYFGLLTTISALAALYGDLIILPLVLRIWPPKRPAAPLSR